MNGIPKRRLQVSPSIIVLTLVMFGLVTACATTPVAAPDEPGWTWSPVRPGVEYAHIVNDAGSWHVTRIHLDQDDLVIFGSAADDRGRTVSDFADEHDAIVAINGDYFDEDLAPVGPSRGYCGDWDVRAAPVSRKQPVFVAGPGRAEIIDSHEPIPEWAGAAVSGWPRVVDSCRAIPSNELPGSDFFTRAPHIRTAVGLSEDERTVFFVVADRIEDGEFGITLPQLGHFMRSELEVCEALNLDGGGSSAMAVDEQLVSRPKSGSERNVANHLGVIERREVPACPEPSPISRASLQEIAERLELEAQVGSSGVRVILPYDEGSILIDQLGNEVLMSGSLIASAEKAAEMKGALRGALRVSWTTPLDDGRERVQLGGRAPFAAVEGELRKLVTLAD